MPSSTSIRNIYYKKPSISLNSKVSPGRYIHSTNESCRGFFCIVSLQSSLPWGTQLTFPRFSSFCCLIIARTTSFASLLRTAVGLAFISPFHAPLHWLIPPNCTQPRLSPCSEPFTACLPFPTFCSAWPGVPSSIPH